MKRLFFTWNFMLLFCMSNAQYNLAAIGPGVQPTLGNKYSVCEPWGMLAVDPPCSTCIFQFEYSNVNGQVYSAPGNILGNFADFWMGTGTYRCKVEDGGIIYTTNDVIVLITDSDALFNSTPNDYQRLSIFSTTCNQVNLKANYSQYPGYQWMRNNAIIPGATSFNYSATLSGDYTCRLYNTCGWTYSDTLHISIPTSFAKPVITTPGGNFMNCNNTPIQLSTPVVPGAHYKWFVNGIYSAQLGDVNQINSFIANGSIKVVVTNLCKSDTSLPVQVTLLNNPLPAPLISYTASSPICDPVVLKVASGNYQYQWFKNGALLSGSIDSVYVASSSGTYTCTIYNACGDMIICQPVVITINSKPLANITPAGPTTFCSGSSVKLKAAKGNGYSWQWLKGNQPIINGIDSIYFANITGTYKVKITNAVGCTKISTGIAITVNPKPAAVITPSGPVSFCNGDSVVLKSSYGIGYQWKRNGTLIAGTKSYTVKTAGNYWVVVTNFAGCTQGSAVVNVTVPCRDGIINSEEDFKVYPNPSSNEFLIHKNILDPVAVDVTDITGRVVWRSLVLNEEEVIGKDWPSGIYILHFLYADKAKNIRLVKSSSDN